MVIRIKDLIAVLRKPQTTSADLVRALDAARREAATIEAGREEAVRAYNAGLLDLDEPQLKALAARRSDAEVARDRVQHLIQSLEVRIEETRAAEVEAAFQAELSAINAEAERVAHLIRTRYPKLAGELVDLLKQISAVDRKIEPMNRKLSERGEAQIEDVQARGLPKELTSHSLRHTIWGGVRLPEIEGFSPGWEVTRWNAATL